VREELLTEMSLVTVRFVSSLTFIGDPEMTRDPLITREPLIEPEKTEQIVRRECKYKGRQGIFLKSVVNSSNSKFDMRKSFLVFKVFPNFRGITKVSYEEGQRILKKGDEYRFAKRCFRL
jgi:hypothetical protein